MTEDWLTTEEEWLDELTPGQVNEIVNAAVFDDATPSDRKAVAPTGLPPLQARLVRAMRALSPRKRIYLRAYVGAGCNRSSATRLLNKRNIDVPNPGTVSRWFDGADFQVALDAMKKLYLDTAGLDPTGVMLKASRVYEEAMTPPVVYQTDRATGEVTVVGEGELDLTNAMRAVEFAGRVNRMTTGDEAGTRVTLNIVNIADKEQRDVVAEQ